MGDPPKGWFRLRLRWRDRVRVSDLSNCDEAGQCARFLFRLFPGGGNAGGVDATGLWD